jgi:integrase
MTVDPMQVVVPRFIEFLRTVEVSPNGHSNTAKRRLRDKGVIYVLETCRSVYHFGLRHRFIPRHTNNPFTEMRIGALRVRDAKPVFVFDAEQELAFLRACNPWEFAIHFTIAKTGIRPGELSHALIEDADLELGWLYVRSKPELGWFTKTSRERRVPLVAEVIKVVRQRHAAGILAPRAIE